MKRYLLLHQKPYYWLVDSINYQVKVGSTVIKQMLAEEFRDLGNPSAIRSFLQGNNTSYEIVLESDTNISYEQIQNEHPELLL